MLILPELFSHAKANTSGRGIFPASRYLSDVAGCLSGGACPAQVMSLSNVDDWEKTLKASSETLTATDPDWVFDEKSFGTEKGFIMTASGIMSTAKMDSDRDILEPKGATVESVCPYLWHHISIQPVGKVLTSGLSTIKSGDKDIDAVLFKVGILDVGNGLGRDTALLIEMGAIRNSHGFEAIDAKPIKGAGWHVTKYRTFEISAVTIPANSDAVFTEYSKEKSRFTSDPVKSWIKGHYDERQKSWKGWVAPEPAIHLTPEQREQVIEAVKAGFNSEVVVEATEKKIQALEDFIELKVEHCGCQKNQVTVTEDDEVVVKKSEWDELKQRLADFEAKQTISTPEITTQDIPRVVDPVLASLGL